MTLIEETGEAILFPIGPREIVEWRKTCVLIEQKFDPLQTCE